MLTCDRAATLLHELSTGHLAAQLDEVEELLRAELLVEADPEDLALIGWLEPTVRGLLHQSSADPGAVAGLENMLARADADLRNDWYRMTTGKAEIARREAERVTVRRALGLLRDPAVRDVTAKLAAQSTLLAPNARYVPCPSLGVEVYALTQRGLFVFHALGPRLSRYAGVGLKTFLAAHDKAEGKMRAFAAEVHAVDGNVGHVRKHREQVVIGLMKTGLPAQQALGVFHDAKRSTNMPDVAVTCARNAATFGGPQQAEARLRAAERALVQAGLPAIPIVLGAAKSLLQFDPVERGVARFLELKRTLDAFVGRDEQVYKLAARLMPAAGTPRAIVDRVLAANRLLAAHPNVHGHRGNVAATAVALAALVRTDDALAPAVERLRTLEKLLVQSRLASIEEATPLALECMACPGTPDEVIETIRSLAAQLGGGERANVAIAAAFAKRFAY